MIRLERRPLTGAWPVAVLLSSLLACTSTTTPVRIGLAGPFTDSIGAPMLRAAQLAVLEINAGGGIGGRRLELLVRDDHADPDTAVSIATDFEAAGVAAVVGDVYSGTTLAAAPVYNAARIVQISPSSTSPLITEAGDYTFRICPGDTRQGEALARFTADRLGLKRGTILYLNDEYGRGIRTPFSQEFSRLGGRIDEIDPYLGDRPAVVPYLDRLVRGGTSEFVFIGGNFGEAEEVLRVARSRGIRLPFLGGDALEGVENAGALAEGTYLSTAYLSSFDSPRNRAFVAAYAKQYPGSRPPSQAAAATYDILYLLQRTVAQAGTDPVRLRDAVAAIGRTAAAFSGVTGEIAFDENGDVPRQRVIIGRVESGQIRAVEGL